MTTLQHIYHQPKVTKIEWRETPDGLMPVAILENGKEKKVAWAPQPGSQESFLSCPVYEVLYEGTRGPGKTDALLMDFLQHVGQGYEDRHSA